jgi:hypothetical protein
VGTVLIVWELGGGLGHLVQLSPLARGLAARGHTVYAALRALERARDVFGPGMSALASPWAATPVAHQLRPPVTVSHILHNRGWHDAGQLRGLVAAWRSLYALVRPDVVVFDHAPTALLAARGLAIRKVVIGSGFCVPPDEPGGPVRNLRPWVKQPHAEPGAIAEFERGMVGRVNGVLGEVGAPSIDRVTQVYGEADETLLVTVPELDHFGPREGARYWGPVTSSRQEPLTPTRSRAVAESARFSPEYRGEGEMRDRPRRVFAYVKNFAALPELLGALEDGGYDATVVCDGVTPAVRLKFAAARHVRLVDRPMDLWRAAQRCDLAITNAGHGATAAMLLAGVPALLVPIHLEQGMLARAAVKTGACVQASDSDGEQLVRKLKQVMEPANLARMTGAARAFAAKYAALDERQQLRRMVGRVEGMMQKAAPRAGRGKVFAG